MLSHRWFSLLSLFAGCVVLTILVTSSSPTLAAIDKHGHTASSYSYFPDTSTKAPKLTPLFDRRESIATSTSGFVGSVAEWGALRAATNDIPVYHYFVP